VNFKIQNVRITDRLACYYGIQMYKNFPFVTNTVLRMKLTYTGTNVHLFRFSSVRGK
jgi:hypothetical protein